MEMTAIYIYGTIGALFCLIIGAMLGYARREHQHGETVKKSTENVCFQRHALMDMHKAEIEQERNVIRELEISLLQAGEAIERKAQQVERAQANWRFADKFRKALVNALVINHLWDFKIHSDNPVQMLAALIAAERAEALDPAVSQKAKNLHTRGVRKGAAMGRKQMAKLMQKSIDNQAETIHFQTDFAQRQAKLISEQATAHAIYVEAVHNALDNKIALPGVRKALKQAILDEQDRMRAVDNFLKD